MVWICDIVTDKKLCICYDEKNNVEVLMAIQKRKRLATVDITQCVACGSCIKVCPRNAITVPKGIYAVVDESKCIGCGLCVKACPASVIHITTHESNCEEDLYES